MRAIAGLGAAGKEEIAGRHATVHQFKGEEAEAVLVLLPDDTRTDQVLHMWTDGCTGAAAPLVTVADTAEALRVLYVAVTRAKRLLALSLPAQHVEPVAQFLISQEVPVAPTLLPGPASKQQAIFLPLSQLDPPSAAR
jgi:superfamily I DNA/RNA helicase